MTDREMTERNIETEAEKRNKRICQSMHHVIPYNLVFDMPFS
jgi:hypothetical protein